MSFVCIYSCLSVCLPFGIVDFRQTIPAENGTACPGGKLQYICTALVELHWEIDGSRPITFTESMEVNSIEAIDNFSLVLIRKTTTSTGIKIITTATNNMVTSNLDGQQVACYSAASHDTLNIQVAGIVVL